MAQPTPYQQFPSHTHRLLLTWARLFLSFSLSVCPSVSCSPSPSHLTPPDPCPVVNPPSPMEVRLCSCALPGPPFRPPTRRALHQPNHNPAGRQVVEDGEALSPSLSMPLASNPWGCIQSGQASALKPGGGRSRRGGCPRFHQRIEPCAVQVANAMASRPVMPQLSPVKCDAFASLAHRCSLHSA